MPNRYDGFAASDAAKKLGQNKDAVDSLANTPDGRAAMDFASKNEAALKAAMESGDTGELSKLLSSFLSTDAGSRIAASLGDILK